MRKILLHSATIDRHGKWRDAGSELTVGAEDITDTDLTTTRADELINSQRAVAATTARSDAAFGKAPAKRASRSKVKAAKPAAEKAPAQEESPVTTAPVDVPISVETSK
ncbi:hypothetical protein [Sphingobium sp. KCTC 72723]|uniref:hypothetical protein n=1 Tax=Sphingobium sp. KCTC 72723 TaxID=2733867 RepID=UPI00165D98CA|nr:hypothetical protein [Sphingobium sp. KCTC 72723]